MEILGSITKEPYSKADFYLNTIQKEGARHAGIKSISSSFCTTHHKNVSVSMNFAGKSCKGPKVGTSLECSRPVWLDRSEPEGVE